MSTLLTRVTMRLAGRAEKLAPRLAHRFRIEATDRGVTRLVPGRGIAGASAAARRHAVRAREELAQYLAGRRSYFCVPLDLSELPAFQSRVLAQALRVGFGDVVSYRALARRVGAPRAARAVGNALATNPVPILVPCHRVVRADGTWGHYAFGGSLKTALLGLERRPALVGSATTRVVCRLGCPAERRIGRAHRIAFRSLAEARRAGYRPCRRCFTT